MNMGKKYKYEINNKKAIIKIIEKFLNIYIYFFRKIYSLYIFYFILFLYEYFYPRDI